MGLPLSRFEQLSHLSKDADDKSFENFKMTAIVIHENKNLEFKEKMQQEFSDLDIFTGENFLFITFIDPPKSWDPERDSWDSAHDFYRECMKNMTAECGMDDVVVLNKLKRAFHLEYEKLPVILLTNNIAGQDFLVIKTSENQIANQLMNIGEFCDKQPKSPSLNDDAVKDLVQKLGGGHNVHLESSISDIICDADAERGVKNGDPDWVNDSKLERVKSNLKKAITSLNEFREQMSKMPIVDEETVKLYEQLILNIADPLPASSGVATVGQQSIFGRRARSPLSENSIVVEQKQECEFSIIRKENLQGYEEDTLAFCMRYNMIAKASRISCGFMLEDVTFQQLQSTVMAILLGKMFEIETNSSVVQMMRKVRGIQMPDYYCKYQEGKDGIIPVEDKPIDLNGKDGNGNNWKPLTLGQSRCAYMYLRNNQAEGFVDWGYDFTNLWREVRDLRNRATHTEWLEENDINEVNEAFVRLQQKYFAKMMQMKSDLRK